MGFSIKFLDPYERKDKDIFFGREDETKNLFNRVKKSSICVLYGASGTGKTSLIQCGLANRFDESDWYEILVRRGSDRTIIEAIFVEINRIQESSTPDSPSIDLIYKSLKGIYHENYSQVYLIFDQFEEFFINAKEEEKKDFKKLLKKIYESEEKFITVLIVIRKEYYTNLNFLNPEIPISLTSAVELQQIKEDVLKEEVIKNIFSSSNISCDDTEGNIIDAIITNTSTRTDSKMKNVELPYLQVYLSKLFEKLNENNKQAPNKICVTKKDLPPPINLEDALGAFLDEEIQSILQDSENNFSSEDIWKMLKLLITSEGTKRSLSIETILKEFNDENGKAELLLGKLEKSKLVRFNDNLYELKHDFLALKVASRWSDEEQIVNLITTIVNSTIKLNRKSEQKKFITGDHFRLFRQYKNKLKFNESEKAEMLQLYNDCEKLFAQSENDKDAIIKTEQKLREDAESEKKNAIKEKEKAKIATAISLAIGVCLLVLLILSSILYVGERKKTIALLGLNAKSFLLADKYDSAYSKLEEIELIKRWTPFLNDLKDSITVWEHVLMFHVVADELSINSHAILYRNHDSDSMFMVRNIPSDQVDVKVKNTVDLGRYNDNHLSGFKLASSGKQFYFAKKMIKNNDTTYLLFIKDLQKNVYPVDSVKKFAAGDFYDNGDFFYVKDNNVLKFNKNTKRSKLLFSAFKHSPNKTLSVKFLKNLNNNSSSYLQINIDSASFVRNILKDTEVVINATEHNMDSIMHEINNQNTSDHSPPPTIQSPANSKFLRQTRNHHIIGGSINNSGKENIIFDIDSSVAKNFLVGYPLDEVLICIFQDSIRFLNYDGKQAQEFFIPHTWQFASLIDNKYILFNKYNNQQIVKQAVLKIKPEMASDNFMDSWFR